MLPYCSTTHDRMWTDSGPGDFHRDFSAGSRQAQDKAGHRKKQGQKELTLPAVCF